MTSLGLNHPGRGQMQLRTTELDSLYKAIVQWQPEQQLSTVLWSEEKRHLFRTWAQMQSAVLFVEWLQIAKQVSSEYCRTTLFQTCMLLSDSPKCNLLKTSSVRCSGTSACNLQWFHHARYSLMSEAQRAGGEVEVNHSCSKFRESWIRNVTFVKKSTRWAPQDEMSSWQPVVQKRAAAAFGCRQRADSSRRTGPQANLAADLWSTVLQVLDFRVGAAALGLHILSCSCRRVERVKAFHMNSNWDTRANVTPYEFFGQEMEGTWNPNWFVSSAQHE